MASTFVNGVCNPGSIKGFKSHGYGGFSLSSPLNQSRRSQLVIRASEKREESTKKKTSLSIEEFEAAVVAGNVPKAPPVPPKPKAPSGTPVIPSLEKRTLLLEQCLDVTG